MSTKSRKFKKASRLANKLAQSFYKENENELEKCYLDMLITGRCYSKIDNSGHLTHYSEKDYVEAKNEISNN